MVEHQLVFNGTFSTFYYSPGVNHFIKPILDAFQYIIYYSKKFIFCFPWIVRLLLTTI